MKRCLKCKTEDSQINYYIKTRYKEKIYYYCESCSKSHGENMYKKHRDRILPRNRLRHKKWYARNRKEKLIKNKTWKTQNIEKVREYHKNYEREKRKNPIYRLNQSVSSSLRKGLNGLKSGKKWELILGYSVQDLKSHLESKFQTGMTWENYGEWHIDHIIPISHFQISSLDSLELKKCWQLSNLQPLWAIDNLRKHNKILIPLNLK